MSEKLFLGLDTSNYTTSVAVCNEKGTVLYNLKKLLPVASGERGLRQSDAVFSHVKNLSPVADLLREAMAETRHLGTFSAIGCSAYPRDVEGSYMPCFLVGTGFADLLGAAIGIPVYRFSHQMGHVISAGYSAALPSDTDSFYAFHVSGGTTEILSVRKDPEAICRIALLGGTKDLNAGQLIDRVGVSLGFPFPAGPSMEQAALRFSGKVPHKKPSVNGLFCNLSGVENLAAGLREKGASVEEIAAFVLHHIGETLRVLTDHLFQEMGEKPVVYAGGVMSCSIIKEILSREGVYFAEPAFSADNAAGVALLTRILYFRENGG